MERANELRALSAPAPRPLPDGARGSSASISSKTAPLRSSATPGPSFRARSASAPRSRNTTPAFNSEQLHLKRLASSVKLRSTFDLIADKYGSIPPEEDDEIDLVTGEIVLDRGRLRLLEPREFADPLPGEDDADVEFADDPPPGGMSLGPEMVMFGEDEDELGDWDNRSGLDIQVPTEVIQQPRTQVDIDDLKEFLEANAVLLANSCAGEDDVSATPSPESSPGVRLQDLNLSDDELAADDEDAQEARRVTPAPRSLPSSTTKRLPQTSFAASTTHRSSPPHPNTSQRVLTTSQSLPNLRSAIRQPKQVRDDLFGTPPRDIGPSRWDLTAPRVRFADDAIIVPGDGTPARVAKIRGAKKRTVTIPVSPTRRLDKGKQRMLGERPTDVFGGVLERPAGLNTSKALQAVMSKRPKRRLDTPYDPDVRAGSEEVASDSSTPDALDLDFSSAVQDFDDQQPPSIPPSSSPLTLRYEVVTKKDRQADTSLQSIHWWNSSPEQSLRSSSPVFVDHSSPPQSPGRSPPTTRLLLSPSPSPPRTSQRRQPRAITISASTTPGTRSLRSQTRAPATVVTERHWTEKVTPPPKGPAPRPKTQPPKRAQPLPDDWLPDPDDPRYYPRLHFVRGGGIQHCKLCRADGGLREERSKYCKGRFRPSACMFEETASDDADDDSSVRASSVTLSASVVRQHSASPPSLSPQSPPPSSRRSSIAPSSPTQLIRRLRSTVSSLNTTPQDCSSSKFSTASTHSKSRRLRRCLACVDAGGERQANAHFCRGRTRQHMCDPGAAREASVLASKASEAPSDLGSPVADEQRFEVPQLPQDDDSGSESDDEQPDIQPFVLPQIENDVADYLDLAAADSGEESDVAEPFEPTAADYDDVEDEREARPVILEQDYSDDESYHSATEGSDSESEASSEDLEEVLDALVDPSDSDVSEYSPARGVALESEDDDGDDESVGSDSNSVTIKVPTSPWNASSLAPFDHQQFIVEHDSEAVANYTSPPDDDDRYSTYLRFRADGEGVHMCDLCLEEGGDRAELAMWCHGRSRGDRCRFEWPTSAPPSPSVYSDAGASFMGPRSRRERASSSLMDDVRDMFSPGAPSSPGPVDIDMSSPTAYRSPAVFESSPVLGAPRSELSSFFSSPPYQQTTLDGSLPGSSPLADRFAAATRLRPAPARAQTMNPTPPRSSSAGTDASPPRVRAVTIAAGRMTPPSSQTPEVVKSAPTAKQTRPTTTSKMNVPSLPSPISEVPSSDAAQQPDSDEIPNSPSPNPCRTLPHEPFSAEITMRAADVGFALGPAPTGRLSTAMLSALAPALGQGQASPPSEPTLAQAVNGAFTLPAPPCPTRPAETVSAPSRIQAGSSSSPSTSLGLMLPPPVPTRRAAPPAPSSTNSTPRKRRASTYADDDEYDEPAPMKFTTTVKVPRQPPVRSRSRSVSVSSRTVTGTPSRARVYSRTTPASTPRKKSRTERHLEYIAASMDDDEGLEWGLDEEVGDDARVWREGSVVVPFV